MTDNVTPIESGKRKRRPKVGAPPVHGDWRDAFVYTREGEVAKVVSNAVAILSADERWAGVLAFDVFGGREILQKAPVGSGHDARGPAEGGRRMGGRG
jgi:hypothetical protein